MKKLELGFGTFELHQDFVIGRVNEGIHFNLELNSILGENLISHYGVNQKLGYISVRENSYSIDPMVHLFNTRYDNLCSIGIVEKSHLELCTAMLEEKFFKPGKLKSFSNKDQALSWINSQILESSNKNDSLNLN
jgi:hypothetical protein